MESTTWVDVLLLILCGIALCGVGLLVNGLLSAKRRRRMISAEAKQWETHHRLI